MPLNSPKQIDLLSPDIPLAARLDVASAWVRANEDLEPKLQVAVVNLLKFLVGALDSGAMTEEEVWDRASSALAILQEADTSTPEKQRVGSA